MNATEVGLAIAFVDGHFQLTTTQDWQVVSITADFEVYLTDGTVDSDKTRYLIDRMKGCPVSRNLSHDVIKKTQLVIHPFQQPSAMDPIARSPQPQPQPQKYTSPKLTNSTILSLNSSGL